MVCYKNQKYYKLISVGSINKNICFENLLAVILFNKTNSS
jgi:hypothetical protein